MDNLAKIVATALPLVFGGFLAIFRPYIESEKDLRSRIQLIEKGLIERLATKHTMLLRFVLSLKSTDDVFRGDGKEQPDLIGDYAEEISRNSRIPHFLAKAQRNIGLAYTSLFLTTCCGIFFFLIAICWESAQSTIVIVAFALLAIQFIAVITIYWLSKKITEYEEN